ncbi:hypothetical protein OG455_03920 [Kitasatospora sp. NBC_01287]|uniref:hypothetical protein n=1 Tax=Kitasatospora sp. NBC_01287 TaxID=2903573 RepID=UPI0022559F23|nr:hypothetical protein [Kitasatospora sp. NBC_01287]MCX4744678.1 hypothetical protein [Kitasatospora sp. NBC_01287]
MRACFSPQLRSAECSPPAAGGTPGIAQALRHLGSAAARFGESEDGPYLLDALTTAAEGARCSTESPAKGLGRLRVAGATDALVHAWESTIHSYAREALLEGLRGCTPEPVAEGFTEEALDDCEPRVQEAARALRPPRNLTARDSV